MIAAVIEPRCIGKMSRLLGSVMSALLPIKAATQA
jgi:hypothetical protein